MSGGPGWYPASEHCGIGTAIVVGGRTYLVDAGDRVPEQYMRANPNQQETFEEFSSLAGVFLTHLHSDHTIDYFKLFNYAWWHGIGQVQEPITVRGPGRRETLTRALDQEHAPGPFNPDNPMPGTVDMTDALFAGYATDINDRQRDNGLPVLRDLLDVQDIVIPGATTQWESMEQMPSMDPFTVHEDDRVKVTAIAVNHFPIYPALAFRFDTDDGSIVVSGDTGPTPNLITLAQDADVLVHEVIDETYIDTVFADQEGIAQHLRKAHTPATQLGPIAEEAGVSTLVLHHLVPSEPPMERFMAARDGFSGNFHIATELDVIPVRQP
ncbi:MBL fold metallo-hydrolase [Citricoccus alkalitolerans]|uniref:MBL fold metallo-hydrolase n=1 Tax=Citricoccus alkalitolerans TaxID=246603 RepID=A0ABV8XV00_9MICC